MAKKLSKQVTLDDTDRALLALLQADASLSNAELSERLSLSVTPCWRRRRRLEEEGVIRDYQANLDRRLLGLEILAFVQVRFASHGDKAPDDFEAVVRALPGGRLPQDHRRCRLPAAGAGRGPGQLQ
jgi:DNA-binding Lrp family transcriptional regulator